MFAPWSNRNPDTAATIPGLSAQPISRRAVYGCGSSSTVAPGRYLVVVVSVLPNTDGFVLVTVPLNDPFPLGLILIGLPW